MRLFLLILHVGGGIIGLLSGAAAMVLRKGSRWHARLGNVFVIAMTGMGLCGSALALRKNQMNNVAGGLLTAYMVATAWMTARRRENETSAWDSLALAGALAVAGVILTLGVKVVRNPAIFGDGVPAAMYFVMSGIALLSATGDLRMLVRGGIEGRGRLVRHLWRMCFALYRDRFVLSRTTAGIPSLAPRVHHADGAGTDPAAIDDFLAGLGMAW